MAIPHSVVRVEVATNDGIWIWLEAVKQMADGMLTAWGVEVVNCKGGAGGAEFDPKKAI